MLSSNIKVRTDSSMEQVVKLFTTFSTHLLVIAISITIIPLICKYNNIFSKERSI
mgnify:CR=1 FL=1